MYKKIFSFIIVSFLFSASGQAKEPKWLKDYDKALAKAQKSGQNLLLDFYSPT